MLLKIAILRKRWNELWLFLKRYPLMILMMGILLCLILVPIIAVIITSFQVGHPAMPEGWSTDSYRYALKLPLFYKAALNTIILAGVGTSISLSIALFFAWLIERTDMPCRDLAWCLLLIPLAMPGVLFALSWALLLGPRGGIINVFLRYIMDIFGIHLTTGPINIYSLGGMMFLDGIRGVSTIFLMTVGAFRMMDPALEEAARASKAGRVSTLFRVTLPVLMPTILLAAMFRFVLSMESFELPLAIGLPANIFTLSTLIFFITRINQPMDYGAACVFAVILMFFMLLLIIAYRYGLRRYASYATVTGKGYRPRVIPIGKWRYLALLMFILYFLFMVVLPFLVLFWGSLLPVYLPFSLESLKLVNFSNYIEIFTAGRFSLALWNTLQVTVVTATAAMFLALIASWIVTRSELYGRGILDTLLFLPLSIPGIVVGLAFVMVFLKFPFNLTGLYGTLWIIILGLITQNIAFGTRVMNSAIVQIHKELEEAAFVCKASQAKTIFAITLPLLFPSFAAAWVWTAISAMRAFSVPLMLESKNTYVLATLMWAYWDEGSISMASVVGVLLIVVLIPITFLFRRFIVNISGQQG